MKTHIKTSIVTPIIDELPEIQKVAAINPKTSERTLIKLAESDSGAIRNAVAQNPNAPAEALDILAHDHLGAIRLSVVKHPNTSAKTLEYLLEDRQSYIRTTAQRRLDELSEEAST